jgi:hypothetical protein
VKPGSPSPKARQLGLLILDFKLQNCELNKLLFFFIFKIRYSAQAFCYTSENRVRALRLGPPVEKPDKH